MPGEGNGMIRKVDKKFVLLVKNDEEFPDAKAS